MRLLRRGHVRLVLLILAHGRWARALGPLVEVRGHGDSQRGGGARRAEGVQARVVPVVVAALEAVGLVARVGGLGLGHLQQLALF